MNKDNVKTLQKAQLVLMDKFHEICVTHGVKYYIAGGTLLGAVRHKGFIPWDADMDIAMPREDYEKFIEVYAKELEPLCKCIHHKNYKYFTKPHALIILPGSHLKISYEDLNPQFSIPGVYIEIFPLDCVPVDEKLQKKQEADILFWKGLIYRKASLIFSENNPFQVLIKKFIRALLSPISFKCLGTKLQKVMQRHNNDKEQTPLWCSMAGAYGYKKESVKKELFGMPTLIEFEGRKYYAPEKTHDFLVHYYNDYMRLPSVEEQNRMYNYFQDIQIDF